MQTYRSRKRKLETVIKAALEDLFAEGLDGVQIVLGRELGRRGFERQSTGTARRWRGLRVKDEWRQTDSGPRWPVKSARNWHGD